MRRYLFLFLFFQVYQVSSGQQVLIEGHTIDRDTGDPIPFVNIVQINSWQGTSSNINGQFILATDTLPAILTISHISYEKKKISVGEPGYLEIQLSPGKTLMKELVIDGSEDPGYTLLKRAYNKITSRSEPNYGRAIYRQYTENGSESTEFIEIFYDVKYDRKGIQEWEIQEGRYGINNHSEYEYIVHNRNFTLLSRLFPFYQPPTSRLITPVSPMVDHYYDINIRNVKLFEDRQIAVLNCKPHKELKIPAFEGEVWVDTESYDLLKIDGEVNNDYFRVVTLNNNVGRWKNYVIKMEAAFKPDHDDLLLDYISYHQSFDYYIGNKKSHEVKTTSFLSFFVLYVPEIYKRLGVRIQYNISDKEKIQQAGYNPFFWKNNPIIARTLEEEKVISFFESKDAFDQVYLNERSQVQIDLDTLDSDSFIMDLTEKLKIKIMPENAEKVYLHLDKPQYISGETLRFNAFVVNLSSHQLTDYSKILYVDLVSPKDEIIKINQFPVQKGISKGTIDIPVNATSGIYRIRAYTRWMKDITPSCVFDSEVNIINMDDFSGSELIADNHKGKGIILQFFPEGGNLIYKVPSRVAFKAVDSAGKGIEVKGTIVDDSAGKITDFSTRHNGMGSFSLLPEPGKLYYAYIWFNNDLKVFSLPYPEKEGVVFSVNNIKKRDIDVLLKPSDRYENNEVYLIGQIRGKIYHKQKIVLQEGGTLVTLPRDKFPEGICQLTVFNIDHLPIAERLIFIKNESFITTSLNFDKGNFGPGEKVGLMIELNDPFGRPIREAVLSVSVADNNIVSRDPDEESIVSNLLMTSVLSGIIEDPGFYFRDNVKTTNIALDLVMLTHGWRRFKWDDIFNEENPIQNSSHEKNLVVTGTAYLEDEDDPLSHGTITFLSMDERYPGALVTTTDKYGKFRLDKVNIPDTIVFLTKSLNEKGKPVNTDILFDGIQPLPVQNKAIHKFPIKTGPDVIKHQYAAKEKYMIDSVYRFNESILLDEITVKAERYYAAKYGKPDVSIEIDEQKSNYPNIIELLKVSIARLSITGSGLNTQFRFRGSNSLMVDQTPLFVLDGIPLNTPLTVSTISTTSAGTPTDLIEQNTTVEFDNSSLVATLMSIQPGDVKKIDVLNSYGTGASAFGYMGNNGVILIQTKLGAGEIHKRRTRGYERITIPGFSISKEIYQPVYTENEGQNIKPDKRITLLFDIFRISEDMKGILYIEFYNSDLTSSFQVVIEGLSSSGIPFSVIKNINPDMTD